MQMRGAMRSVSMSLSSSSSPAARGRFSISGLVASTSPSRRLSTGHSARKVGGGGGGAQHAAPFVPNPMFDLTGKTAVVTGGGRDIGAACAVALARAGADIVINYNSSKEHADRTVDEIHRLGREAVAIQADVFTQVRCIVHKTACLPACLPACLHACLPACLHACMYVYMHV
jgi:hypothetical protein